MTKYASYKKLHKINFAGALLKRGFWLYVWKITYGKNVCFYVGRTGDASSPNASSPFRRMGMHFDLKPHATANCIIKQLKRKGIDPAICLYSLLAYGPIFPEQKNMNKHKIYRDKIAALEAELAHNIKTELRREVIGKHPRRRAVNNGQFVKIWSKFRKELN